MRLRLGKLVVALTRNTYGWRGLLIKWEDAFWSHGVSIDVTVDPDPRLLLGGWWSDRQKRRDAREAAERQADIDFFFRKWLEGLGPPRKFLNLR